MKKCTYVFQILLLALLSSCQKQGTTPTSNTHYSFDNVHDYYVTSGMPINIKASFNIVDSQYTGNTYTVAVQNQPTGVTIAPMSVDVTNTDSFSFYMTATGLTNGTYPVKLMCTTPNGYQNPYYFNIVAEPACNAGLYGTWAAYDSGWTVSLSPSHYTALVGSVGTANSVYMQLSLFQLTCDLVCHNGTLTSEPYFGLINASAGSGTFTNNRIVLNYTVLSSTNFNVTTILTR